MKLTIEHLAPYLPYGLLFDISHTEYGKIESKRLEYCKLVGLSNTDLIAGCSFKTNIEAQNHGLLFLNIDVSKPILRPLSDLTKEIEHNGKTFVPIVKLCEIFTCYECEDFNEIELTEFEEGYLNTINSLETLDYATAQKLLEWHVDLFELIENNLAIDINTI